MPRETKKVLICVRTYPTPAKRGVEVSCTAAITDDGEWIRLFPIPYRFLDYDKRFKKYQWISVEVEKARDSRPESYKINADSIQIISDPLPTSDHWKQRKDVIFPLKAHCLCCLQKTQVANGHPTLGIFKPRQISRLIIQPEAPDWTSAQQAIMAQGHLWVNPPSARLEKVPYSFRYEFTCDEETCTGHTLICTDWEIGEAWRKWSDDYGDRWEEKFRLRFEAEMIHKLDTHFYVGTVHKYPNAWIIVGLFIRLRLKSNQQHKMHHYHVRQETH